jgi:hypothetical protein
MQNSFDADEIDEIKYTYSLSLKNARKYFILQWAIFMVYNILNVIILITGVITYENS